MNKELVDQILTSCKITGTLALLGNVRQQLHAFAGSSIGQNLGIAEDLLVFKNKIAFDKRDAEEKR